ncbi:glycosyltransferase family 4 protein [Rubellimicrobium rubrum]|nr:glycosyltransferase family 4 protein [Rubellimicrobium rubrum]
MIQGQNEASASVSPFRPASNSICLVTGELAGPDYNGGIGTAVRGLALALAREGYQVDILYTRVERRTPFCFRGSFEDQVDLFRQKGIRLICLSHDGEWNDWLAKSYQVMLHLQARRYDLVFFNDMHGSGYYSQLARKTASPDFARTPMVVVAHSATQWVMEMNQDPITSVQDVRLVEIERRSIELADALISPSAYMLDRYKGYGWTLPDNTVVLPNLLPKDSRSRRPELRASPVDEIVFFGRLERRKGLWLFCEALNRIKHEMGDLKVTFLGRMTEEEGELTGFPVLKRSAGWPFEVQILHNFDREQAINYLKAGRRVAVMPAAQDNSPCAILECLYEGIPFVASSGSGGQELIAKECWASNLFEPTVEGLSHTLRSIRRNGAATGLPATDPDQNERMMMDWLEQIITASRLPSQDRARPGVRADRPEGSARRHLLLLASARVDPVETAASIERALTGTLGAVDVTVLTDDPPALIDRIPDRFLTGVVTVADVRIYQEVLLSFASTSTIIGLSHASQPITPDWLERAERCFGDVRDIVALTGLAATTAEAPRDPRPYISDGPEGRKVREFPVGHSRILFPLALDTNSGFIAIRPEAIAIVGEIGPFDERYERFKRMQDWVHEIVLRLDEQGHRFEILADCALDGVAVDQPSPVFRLGQSARSLIGSRPGYSPGSEPALLARLAAETMVASERRRSAADCLGYLSAKLAQPLGDPTLYATEEATARTLIAMAQASGQTELAHELAAERLMPEGEEPQVRRPLASYLRRSTREIRLFDLAAANAFTSMNLSHEWSFRLFSDTREIEVHPNTSREGRAGMLFSDVDLTDMGALLGGVRLASPTSRPVRFRIDMVALDGSSYFGVDRIARANESLRIDERLPPDILTRCTISLSTEMAHPGDQAQDAWARWTDLMLTVQR